MSSKRKRSQRRLVCATDTSPVDRRDLPVSATPPSPGTSVIENLLGPSPVCKSMSYRVVSSDGGKDHGFLTRVTEDDVSFPLETRDEGQVVGERTKTKGDES